MSDATPIKITDFEVKINSAVYDPEFNVTNLNVTVTNNSDFDFDTLDMEYQEKGGKENGFSVNSGDQENYDYDIFEAHTSINVISGIAGNQEGFDLSNFEIYGMYTYYDAGDKEMIVRYTAAKTGGFYEYSGF